ncbi:maleylacetate reductase [Pseudonocardia sediminis]|uniref:Maleylacetate reductase n=1 Tax=Pseudonocardia sediminis TaxID=1397368 RepID=A0A4Q7UX91_PSEST|nr:maleylacetate reductase [Pseudonocardia sediminis]
MDAARRGWGVEHRFEYQGRPGRVVFGAGRRAELGAEAERLGLRRVLVVTTPGRADLAAETAATLGDRLAGLHPHAVMHVPSDVAAHAVATARELGADGCVAVGGGSAVGLGKIVARDTGIPLLAVPTTYSGSEATPIWGMTTDGVKRTGHDPRVLPVTVVYDPELTLSMPVRLTAESGLNALAHAAETLYAPDVSPVTSLVAAGAARSLVTGLPKVLADPASVDARAEVMQGAWLAGWCLASATMSLHHKLCHTLGGTFDLPHAPTHANVLAHVLAFNLPAAPAADAALREALGTDDVPARVHALVAELGAARSLADLGLPADGVERVVELATADPYANPRPVTPEGVRAILAAAFTGASPVPHS